MTDHSTQQPPPLSKTDRRISRFATRAVRWLYRSVDVYVDDRVPRTGPVVAVSNHFGGFADPLLLMSVMERVPRIVARDKIWDVPIAGRVMKAIGGIPVHKPAEHHGPTSNEEMFGAAYEALEHGEVVLIYPEGITVDDPSIAKIKTGAARIALGARSSGVENIQIVPVGIHYEDKAALRSRVFINIGAPFDLDAEIVDRVPTDVATTPENRELVRALTDDIEDRLRRVAPDFENWDEARHLTNAAEITVRAGQDDKEELAPASARDRLAGELGRTAPPAKEAVIEAVTEYDANLDAIGLTDAQAYERLTGGRFLRYLLWSLLVGLLLLPFALIGISLNLIPLLIIGAIGLLPISPAVQATVKPLAALVLFPLTWAIAAWQIVFDNAGVVWTVISVLLIPLYLVAAILLSERIVLLWRAFRDWRGSKKLENVQDDIVNGRQRVVDSVRSAVG